MAKIPINFGRDRTKIQTGARGPGLGFGQQEIQLTGAGQQAMAGELGEFAETGSDIALGYAKKERGAEEASDLASGKARSDAVYRKAKEDALSTTDHDAIQKIFNDAHNHVSTMVNGKNDNGVPYFRNKQSRAAFGNWTKREKERQNSIAMTRRVSLARTENASRFDVAEGDLIKTSGKLDWQTADEAEEGMVSVLSLQSELAKSRVSAGLLTESQATLHLEAQRAKAQQEFATQELAKMYNSPVPPDVMKIQVEKYKDAVDKIGTELTERQKKMFFKAADDVVKASAAQQKIQQDNVKKEQQARQKTNIQKIPLAVDGSINISPQELKSLDIPWNEKKKFLSEMAKDEKSYEAIRGKAKEEKKLALDYDRLNKEIRAYDGERDPDATQWADLTRRIAAQPSELRTFLKQEFESVTKSPFQEGLRAVGATLDDILKLNKPAAGYGDIVRGLTWEKRIGVYGSTMDDLRRYASTHTNSETMKYAEEVLKPLREEKNLTDLYESYTKPQPEVYKQEVSPGKSLDEVEMIHPKTGERIFFNRKTKKVRKVN